MAIPGTIFVLLSFEGPDPYARAGGIASRVSELSRTLAGRGLETHLFFIGDPDLAPYEPGHGGLLHLHRWGQWISRYHPGGVYDGEEGKLSDWQESLPPWLASELLAPAVAEGRNVVVLAEEWQTAETVVRLGRIVRENGWRDRVHLIWNANNTFSFDRIDWPALAQAATLTTVSRYMKHEMWDRGVNPRVIPNGIEDCWLQLAPPRAVASLRRLFSGRLSLLKVGRFDPNKRWLAAIEAVAQLKHAGASPLLVARGGSEGHGREVLERASALGLTVRHCWWDGPVGLREAMAEHLDADVVFLEGHLDFDDRKALYQACNFVLANSAIEPFGLVGLEAMASGGIVLVGATGEDYALSGHDSISLQTARASEIVHHVLNCRMQPRIGTRMRKAARVAAARFTWSAVLDRALFPLLSELGIEVAIGVSVIPGTPEEEPRKAGSGPQSGPGVLVAATRPATVVSPITAA